MTITARDIQLKQFKVRLRGFDVQEVDFFLDQLAESFTNLEIENSRLAGSLKNARQEIDDLKERDEKLKKAYQDLRKNYLALKDELGSESRMLLHEAQREADRILSEARSRVEDMAEDFVNLKRQKEQMDDYLRKIVEFASGLLEKDEGRVGGAGDPDSKVKHLRQIQS